jgi:hypothetical protein
MIPYLNLSDIMDDIFLLLVVLLQSLQQHPASLRVATYSETELRSPI